MNTVQHFIDNPTPEAFTEVAKLLSPYYIEKNRRGHIVKKGEPGHNLSSETYNYPIEANNFWHFVFKSPEHLNIVLEHIKSSPNFERSILEKVIFHQSHTSTLGGIEHFNPLLFSTEQNQFLFLTNSNIQTKINHNDFAEFARNYWLGTLQPADQITISKFYDDNLGNPDADNLSDAMMKIYEEPCLDLRKYIALYIATSCILKDNSDDYKMKFAQKTGQHELFDYELRDSTISLASGFWFINTEKLGGKDLMPLEIGALYARNAATYKFIKENEILVEKDFLSNIITAPKTAKVSKL